jgi:hypothetical protein
MESLDSFLLLRCKCKRNANLLHKRSRQSGRHPQDHPSTVARSRLDQTLYRGAFEESDDVAVDDSGCGRGSQIQRHAEDWPKTPAEERQVQELEKTGPAGATTPTRP